MRRLRRAAAVFLPRISLLPVILAALLAGCGQPPGPPPDRIDVAEVVAGTGDVAEDVVLRVNEAVATQLPALQRVFGGMEIDRFFVHVHESRESMPEALVAGLHEDSPGFALLGRHQIHLVWGEMRRLGSSVRGVVVHELVHELLDQYCAPNGRYIPRWFHEGLAQLLAGDTYLGAREQDLVWRVGSRGLLRFSDLEDHFPQTTNRLRTAYAQSYSYVSWLANRYGLDLLLQMARDTDDITTFAHALVGRTGLSTLRLNDEWRDHLVHGSGASWRAMLEQWFPLMMIAALPILVLALMRRLKSEERAARRLAERAAYEQRVAEERAREAAEAAALMGDDERPSG